LPKYGSLEFRAMRGVDHPKPIIQWASTLLNMREEAKKYDNPKQIIEAFSLQGPDNFTDNLVNKLDGVAEANDKEGYKMLMEGMRNAQFVAYSTDWDDFNPKDIEIGGIKFPGYMNPDEIDEPMEDF